MKRDFQVEIVSSKQVAQHLHGTDFSHLHPLARLYTPSQFFAVAIEPYKAHLSPIRSDLLEDALHELIVLAFAVDKGEDCVNSLFRGFLYHLQSIFVDETPEGLCSKLENRLDKLDRDMIVEKLEPR